MSFVRMALLIDIALLFAIGLVMIFNTSSAEVLDLSLDRSTHQALLRQIMYAFMGIGVAWGLSCLGYRCLLELSTLLLGGITLLLLLTLIPSIGIQANGARRWLGLGGYTIQPSEFVKFILPLYFIQHILELKGKPLSLKGFIKLLATVGMPMVLILVEPNNGTAAMIGCTLLVLLILTGVPAKYWVLPMLAAALVGGVVAYHLPYVSARMRVYLHPELDLKGKGHQPHQAKIAAGSGQWFGKGPGGSLQKLSYLPEAQNDYIAAIYGEEFGFFGILVLLILYMGIGYFGFHIAAEAADVGGCYLAAVITFVICFQAFLNLSVVSGLLPSTGLNLPFFSQGGSSLMVNVAAIGILLNIESGREK